MTALAVLGAINVDLAVTAPRLPGPGQTVLGDRLRRSGGGKGANAAVAAARDGAAVRLIGAVGADADGAAQLADLVAAGVDIDGVAVLAGVSTGAALIVTDPAGENQITVAAGANSELSAEHVRGMLDERPPRLLLISSEVSMPAIAAALRWSAAAKVPCVLNPAPARPELAELLDLATVLTPNEGELAALVGAGEVELSPGEGRGEGIARLAELLAGRTSATVAVTRGAAGALIAEPGCVSRLIAAPAVRVVDTTGAGDVFNGVLAARLAAGVELSKAARAAVEAASSSVGVRGAR